MKRHFTRLKMVRQMMMLGSLAMMQIQAGGQVSHRVAVTNYLFTPDQITIFMGDTVIWTNTDGHHNVNGTQSRYPANPESYGNEVGEGWIFSHVFTIPGVYDYVCDPHVSFGMTGKIIVQELTMDTLTIYFSGIAPHGSDISVYPNPASGKIRVAADETIESVAVISFTGAILRKVERAAAPSLEISLDGIPPGVYLIEVTTAENGTQVRRLVKQ